MRQQVKHLFLQSKYVTLVKNTKVSKINSRAFNFFTQKFYIFYIWVPAKFQFIGIYGLGYTGDSYLSTPITTEIKSRPYGVGLS